jgi:uncharacterized protein (TIGR01777 family)
LRVRRGPVSVNWRVKHTGYEYGKLFQDEQMSGPFSVWRHSHRFEPEDGGTRYVDEVEWELPAGPILRLVGGEIAARRELGRMFRFRHERLRHDLGFHDRYRSEPLTVAISGASGMIGTALRHFLTTGGHRVLTLVRREAAGQEEIRWDPVSGYVESDKLEDIDAVVHLAGESIAGVRWTQDKKRRILESRVKGTTTLAKAIAGLKRPPRVVVTASGVDFYGNRGDEILAEDAKPGRGFLSDVCVKWERAWAPLRGRRSRVVFLRFGMVLSPAGGALGTMILPFKMGIGGRLGSGRQYLSWIDLDDAVGLVFHAIQTQTLRGPVNATAPQPVPNATFATTMGRVLGRPTILPGPGPAVKALFGEMGKVLLLDGVRAVPRRAEESGYEFLYPSLEESLRFQLGESE